MTRLGPKCGLTESTQRADIPDVVAYRSTLSVNNWQTEGTKQQYERSASLMASHNSHFPMGWDSSRNENGPNLVRLRKWELNFLHGHLENCNDVITPPR